MSRRYPLMPADFSDISQSAAREAGLVYVNNTSRGIHRHRKGKSFTYTGAENKPVRDAKTKARIKALVIPPAWEEVWICTKPKGHLQATGIDAKGRKQYRYHAQFRAVRDSAKFEHMLDFAKALPDIRNKVAADMRKRTLCREKVLATIISLLEHTLIRVGNEAYAKDNDSFGLTTLHDKHVDILGAKLQFHFKGKSGKQWDLKYTDKRIAKIVRDCQDLPGQNLFAYRGEDGKVHDVTSTDINAYLKEISGTDITAKDFRTWAGTVLAAVALDEFEKVDSETAAKKNVRQAIEQVAARLGNTPTICRKCYVHPEIIEAYLGGEPVMQIKAKISKELKNIKALSAEEAAVLALLHARLAKR